jgi:hypothetical protein
MASKAGARVAPQADSPKDFLFRRVEPVSAEIREKAR